MRPLLLALSLIQVPRLFVSLLLWPLLIGLLAFSAQIAFSASYVRMLNMDAEEVQKESDVANAQDELRFLLNQQPPAGEPRLCRWIEDGKLEKAPSPECRLERLDPVIVVNEPASFDAAPYQQLYNGAVQRLHICKRCRSDLTLFLEDSNSPHLDLHSFSGILMYWLIEQVQIKAREKYIVDLFSNREQARKLQGPIFYYLPAVAKPVNVSNVLRTMILVVNIGFVIVAALWLALKAHRKVLDYFARNHALLPLVAACGKTDFYSALWLITLCRVLCFLIAAVPATYLACTILAQKENAFLLMSPFEIGSWTICIALSLGALTIIASVGELKQRHAWHSVLYTYLPLACCIVGTLVWIVCLFQNGVTAQLVRRAVAILPVFGLSSVILSPVVDVDTSTWLMHSLLATVLIVRFLKLNARWFASHLEEI